MLAAVTASSMQFGNVPVGHRDEAQLLRREPQRERAAVVLDQDGAEPLQGPEDRPVDHHGPVPLVVVAGVLHVEALGQGEVALHGGELPEAPDRVAEVEVDLRSVERALALGDPVLETALLERQRERLGGAFGRLGVNDRSGAGSVESSTTGSVKPKVRWISSVRSKTARISSISWSGVQMMCESSWVPPRIRSSPWSVPGLLVSVDRAELRQPHRQVAVAPHLRLVDEHVERAVHRLDVVVAGVRLHGRVHVLPVLRRGGRSSPTAPSGRCAA